MTNVLVFKQWCISEICIKLHTT